MEKIIILDRDGVINYDSLAYIKSPDEWHAIPGSLEAIAQLNHAGFQVVVATNQSGISRGYYDIAMLNRIHEKMLAELAAVGGYIHEIFFCPHLPTDDCHCRKPKPGLLHQIEKKYQINLADIFFIGDKLSDIQAAHLAGCQPLLVLTALPEMRIDPAKHHAELKNVPQFENLAKAVEYVILQKPNR